MLMLAIVISAAAAASARKARAGKPRAAERGPGAGAAGARSVFLPSPSSPLVAVRVLFRTGSVDDPAGKEGLSALTAAMIGKGGAATRSYSEVLDALYPLAASIDFYGDKESVVFEGTVHRDNLVRYVDLLATQITSPRFNEDDFRRNKQDAIDAITQTLRGNNDEALGKEAMAALMYRGHPYGHPTEGTVAGVRSITLEDVKRFYELHYTRDRMIVGACGGYPPGLPAELRARLARLPARGVPIPRLPRPRKLDGAEVLIVSKDARATAISIGKPIPITRADADFYPLTVARSYLGEHRTFTGVLMNRMRGLRGLNYGDYAYIESFIQDGWSTFPLPNIPRRQQHFEIWIRPVAPVNAPFALRQAVFEVERLLEGGIPEDGLQATRQFLLNYSKLWTQDVSRRLGYAMDAVIYGKDLVAELQARLPKMTKAVVDRAVRKHLKLDGYAVAAVAGDAEELKAALLSGKPTRIVYDTEGTPSDVLKEDQQIERLKLPVRPASVQVVPVEHMFEK